MPLSRLIEIAGSESDAQLAGRWSSFSPVEKAALFKLMPRGRALAFFRLLSFEDQYLMILALPAGSIAPLIEDAPAPVRALFHTLSRADIDSLIDTAFAQPA